MGISKAELVDQHIYMQLSAHNSYDTIKLERNCSHWHSSDR